MPHLPDELIEHIVSDFTAYSEANLKALRSLSLINRQFHRVVQPYLYSQVDTVAKDGSAKLIRTLLHNKELGHWIKVLRADLSPLTDFRRRNLSSAEFFTALEDAKSGLKGIKYYKALFPYIFLLLPNLERIIVQRAKRPAGRRPWLEWLSVPILEPRFGTPDFTKLKHIDADIRGIRFVDLHPIFELRSIEILHFTGGEIAMPTPVSAQEHYRKIWRNIRHNPALKTVKQLAFIHPTPSSDLRALISIATSCPSLEALSIIGKKGKELGAYLHRYIIRIFIAPLTNPAFRYLELWDERRITPDVYTTSRSFMAMRRFAETSPVRHLKLDHGIMACLWDAQNNHIELPSTIQTLHLRSSSIAYPHFHHPSYFVAMILNLSVLAQTGIYKDLRSVQFELAVYDRSHRYLLEAMKDAFQRWGVSCALTDKANSGWGLSRLLSEIIVHIRE
ncbi:hypothetical protein P154DRAFT_607940 [Amniculicola lignicola CBS 123094]|uniref:Uncharacterized protein n=1 Tax=Amniculicola lignicola CBS 123094 TaxID=1392246 RepID=A0A6A5W7A7_9PLEO|nr:hypothetical protein P154DRAFT_607940 [Amniculicola lignicola CBS 123094]